MAFGQENRVATSIGKMVIRLVDNPITNEKEAHFRVSVLDQDGDEMAVRRGDLQPHLTTQQINGLLNFLTALRTQAETEILP